jgi:cation:H+ antiporter
MPPLAQDGLILLFALLFILGAAELFTNGIEWLGQHLGLSEGVVGSVLAAVGTALPETLIPIVAVLGFRGEANSSEIGIGAIAGAPFMLTTLTFSLCGFAVFLFAKLKRRNRELNINHVVIARDLSFFIVCYTAAMFATLINDMQVFQYLVAAGLLFAYGLYLKLTFEHEGESGEAPETLHLDVLLKSGNALWVVVAQVLIGLGGILAGSFLFVKYTKAMAVGLHFHPLILSLIIAPIATELPEKVNSVLWAKSGKDTLALGNISGALVFQSCFPVAFGVAFTPWEANPVVIITGVTAITIASLLLVFVKLRRLQFYHLLIGGFAYVAAIGYIITSIPHNSG